MTETGSREQEIMEVAAQLFAREGYDAVAVRDIAEAVGLSKATLYHYFKDKEEIYARIVIEAMERLCLMTEREIAAVDSPTLKVRRFMETTARFLEENLWSATSVLLGLSGLRQPKSREDAAYWRDRQEGNLRRVIEEGIALGEFRDLDPATTGRAILSCLNWMARWYKPSGPRRAVDFAEEYADLLLNGLKI